MMHYRTTALLVVLLATGCNLYTELDRPQGTTDAGDPNSATDTGNGDPDLETFTDAEFMGDERWRAIDVEIGSDVTQAIPWRIQVPDGIGSSGFGPGGTWLRVFDEEGNPVARQIESWTTGAHIFWVTVDPTPAPTRRFWIQYGIEPDDAGPNSTNVWTDANQLQVWGFASDPASDVPPWLGNAAMVPVGGNGTIAIGGGRVAICTGESDGWTAAASADFGLQRDEAGRTYEIIYRAETGSTGHILSNETLCNGAELLVSADSFVGRLEAGLNCDAGFPEGEVSGQRPPSDTSTFTHATLTVETIQQGYDIAVYTNGGLLGTRRVNTQNAINGSALNIMNVGGSELGGCIDQFHVIDGARSAAAVEASFRAAFSQNIAIGSERPSPDFASL